MVVAVEDEEELSGGRIGMEVWWSIFRFKSLELLESCAPGFRLCESGSSAETSDGPEGVKLCIQQDERRQMRCDGVF